MIFDFGDINKIEETIRSTWDEFRNLLARNECEYDDIERAKGYVFLKQFDDYFNQHNCKKYFTKTLGQLIEIEYVFARGTILKNEESVDYNRFMPISKYITEDNRFSPPGVEWLYLASGYKGDARQKIESAEKCTVKECKAKVGDRFGICHFAISQEFYGKKVVDLTIADELTYEEINSDLEKYGQEVKRKARKIFKHTGLVPYTNKAEFMRVFEKWFSYTDAKLVSEQLLLPVAVADKKYMYAPFQSMAKYFESLGYVGIIYSSTVYPGAKNIVLFDKNMAFAVGDIKEIIIN